MQNRLHTQITQTMVEVEVQDGFGHLYKVTYTSNALAIACLEEQVLYWTRLQYWCIYRLHTTQFLERGIVKHTTRRHCSKLHKWCVISHGILNGKPCR